ncbi:MAG: NAD-dependent epimerase/dehydratase family protein [Verrucomicrobia bacterium]|nr:NAD-dependent epimerase/dehydratase family protein [Verrucomicrobiota bacterium]
MKVLLTGASGFVGSHVLAGLRSQQIPTAVLLRRTSRPTLIADHLPHVQVHYGGLDDAEALRAALRGATHMIHCAGCTKARRTDEFYTINQTGTRHVVEALNAQSDQIQRLVHISSLAVSGPALPSQPAREADSPRPVSEYGKSKLAAEQEVRDRCQVPFVILRPSAVYGPGDADFLALFKAVRAHFRPTFGDEEKALSLVFARDLAQATIQCLTHPAAAGQIYHVAAEPAVTVGEITREIARQLEVWTVPLALPGALLWPFCLIGELGSRLTGKPGVLSRAKYPELRAPGWVCDVRRIRDGIGWSSATPLPEGIAQTREWYRSKGRL